MKKYIPYIALAVIVIAGGIYFALSAKKGNSPANNEMVDHAAMGHGNSVQSHRSYNLQLTSNTDNIQPGQPTKISYKITNDRGEVLKDYTVAHEKIMHFIVVRKDLQGFQHLHPDFNQATGEFSVNVIFPTDGPYRIFPDFTPTPENPMKLTVTLNQDLNVGDLSKYKPQTAVVDKATEKSTDGYKITYYMPEQMKSQSEFNYSLVVEKPANNEPVQLEPYLGAMGHGVIIKEGNLDFIHTHAGGMDMMNMEGMSAEEHAGHMGEPDTMDFSTNFPEPGTYRIFTQFQVGGKVITTDYTIKVN